MSVAAPYDGHRYVSPVVIQRFAGPADPSVPGFYSGAEIWVMEDDGSWLRRVRSAAARHLDHPTLRPDREHVVYSEFDDPSQYVHGNAILFEEHLYSGERKPLRTVPGGAIHHNTISPVDQALSYVVSGPHGHDQVAEVDGALLTVENRRGGHQLIANGISVPGGLLVQCEVVPRTCPRRIAVGIFEWSSRSFRPLTRTPAMHRRPAVSPRGTAIVWQSNERAAVTDDIHIAAIDGSQHRLLTCGDAMDGHPWFARDGRSVFFESNRSGQWEIYKLDVESGAVMQLTSDPTYVSTRPRC